LNPVPESHGKHVLLGVACHGTGQLLLHHGPYAVLAIFCVKEYNGSDSSAKQDELNDDERGDHTARLDGSSTAAEEGEEEEERKDDDENDDEGEVGGCGVTALKGRFYLLAKESIFTFKEHIYGATKEGSKHEKAHEIGDEDEELEQIDTATRHGEENLYHFF